MIFQAGSGVFRVSMKTIHFCFLAAAMSWFFGCVAPQQIDLIEREQRRVRTDTNAMQADLDSMRGTLAESVDKSAKPVVKGIKE